MTSEKLRNIAKKLTQSLSNDLPEEYKEAEIISSIMHAYCVGKESILQELLDKGVIKEWYFNGEFHWKA